MQRESAVLSRFDKRPRRPLVDQHPTILMLGKQGRRRSRINQILDQRPDTEPDLESRGVAAVRLENLGRQPQYCSRTQRNARRRRERRLVRCLARLDHQAPRCGQQSGCEPCDPLVEQDLSRLKSQQHGKGRGDYGGQSVGPDRTLALPAKRGQRNGLRAVGSDRLVEPIGVEKARTEQVAARHHLTRRDGEARLSAIERQYRPDARQKKRGAEHDQRERRRQRAETCEPASHLKNANRTMPHHQRGERAVRHFDIDGGARDYRSLAPL